MFFDASFGELDANLTDFVGALGLVQGAPTVANLNLDLIFFIGNVPRGLLADDQRRTVIIPLLFAVQPWINRQAGTVSIAPRVGQRQALTVRLITLYGGVGTQIDLR